VQAYEQVLKEHVPLPFLSQTMNACIWFKRRKCGDSVLPVHETGNTITPAIALGSVLVSPALCSQDFGW
jgi:hypothetical protein